RAALLRIRSCPPPSRRTRPASRFSPRPQPPTSSIMESIKVLLVDDHTVVRQGLKVLLDTEPDITIVGEAESGRQAVHMTLELRPDVVIMDIAMPCLNGVEATRQILKEVPQARVLILSSYSDDEYVHQLTEAGAAGYLLKHTAATDLIKAVREA